MAGDTKREPAYNLIPGESGVPIKAWTKGVTMEEPARQQLLNAAQLPFIHRWIAAMPDVHYGIGATVGSVIPTKGAIIPAAEGVDIGCGMMAVKTSLTARDLPDNLKKLRTVIEKAVPPGRTNQGKSGDRGAWGRLPDQVADTWNLLAKGYENILAKHPSAAAGNTANHLGTLGTGNHFIEVCLDETERLWFMLHSGSRGVGNRLGNYFIELARNDMRRSSRTCPTSISLTSRKARNTSRIMSRPSPGRRNTQSVTHIADPCLWSGPAPGAPCVFKNHCRVPKPLTCGIGASGVRRFHLEVRLDLFLQFRVYGIPPPPALQLAPPFPHMVSSMLG
jgi:hypothetical protein